MYAVIWVRSTLDDLSRIRAGLSPTEYAAVQVALQEIGSRLRNAADTEGESRSENHRVSFVGPLGFSFEAREAEQTAIVLHLWWIARRRPETDRR